MYYSGNYEKVIGRSTEYIASGDTAFNTFYLKALSEIQLGKPDHAISMLKDASQLFPEETRIDRLLAGQYYEAGNYVSVRNGYTELVQPDSTDVASWLKLAEIASFKQQYDEAIPILEHILMLDSINLSSLLMLGEILRKHPHFLLLITY